MPQTSNNLCASIWSVADILRGDYKPSEYGKVILPFTLLRRLDCVLESSKSAVLAEHAEMQKAAINPEPFLLSKARQNFCNSSSLNMKKIMGDQEHIKDNLFSYIQSFSQAVREIFDGLDFCGQIERMDKTNLLYSVAEKFTAIDLRNEVVSNDQMGVVFEELIRRFVEISNEAAGEYLTPRDLVHLTTALVLSPDRDALKTCNSPVSAYDCASGSGGFLVDALEYIRQLNPQLEVVPFAQDINSEYRAILAALMLIMGCDPDNIKNGDTLSNDLLPGRCFDYCFSSPPFGMQWKRSEKHVLDEHKKLGFDGRFGPGLPRVSDSSLLFVLHLLSKRKPPEEGGTRMGIILSASALSNGGAGSGESEIRRWILENDWLEAVVALPSSLLYNTGIYSYLCIISNRKPDMRKGLVRLIDATGLQENESPDFHSAMRKSIGAKRRHFTDDQIESIVNIFDKFEESPISRILKNTDFGYRKITVERPLRLSFSVTKDKLEKYQSTKGSKHSEAFEKIQGDFDSLDNFLEAGGMKLLSVAAHNAVLECFGRKDPLALPVHSQDGKILADASLRKFENVPISQNPEDFFRNEVLQHTPDAWIDEGSRDCVDSNVGIVGYEINIDRIRLQSQMDRLETQYKNYEFSNLGRLSLAINEVNEDESFDGVENCIYIKKIGESGVVSKLDHIAGSCKSYVQVVLGSDVINDYVVSFFKSDLGRLSLKAAMSGSTVSALRRDFLEKVSIALPDMDEQKRIVNTKNKLEELKKSIDVFDRELALNPASASKIMGKLDGMLETIGELTDVDRVKSLIRIGENEVTEYKSSLSLDLRTNEKGTHIEEAVFKTVVGFLNTKGGVLLVGVSDASEVLGVNAEIDKLHKGNSDKFMLHWKNNLKDRIGEQFYPFIRVERVFMEDKLVLMVECKPSNIACYLDGNVFYVRTNPATDKLEGPKLVAYVNTRFPPVSVT